MSKTRMRVPIPKNVQELLELAQKIYNKHQSENEASPLQSVEDHNWNDIGDDIKKCLELHLEAEELKGKMEKSYRERDILFKKIDETVKASRDVLTGIYRKNMKRMTDWGFQVDDSPRSPKAKQ
jgi:hypothetical protein